MTEPVTLVTRDATLDDLSTQDYRDIYDELREKDDRNGSYAVSLDKFVTLVSSQYSKAQWSKSKNRAAGMCPRFHGAWPWPRRTRLSFPAR